MTGNPFQASEAAPEPGPGSPRDLTAQLLAGRRGAVIAGIAFLVLSFGWMIALGLVMAILLMAFALPQATGGAPAFDLPAILELVPVWAIGLMTALQFAGLGALAFGLVWLGRWPLGEAFALKHAHTAALVAGGLGGFVVGIFPGWIAEQLMDRLPSLDGGNLEMINKALAEGDLAGRIVMLFAVCVIAPVIEELIFRGFLFQAAERAVNPWFAWVASSVLFAGYHADPIHVIAVLFTGLFLGWLRLRSGSVWPGMLAHAGNNCLAAAFAIVLGAEQATQTGTPLLLSLLAAVLTFGMAGVATIGEPPSSSGPRST
jgi:membrane protease YdiL (CAAX protease family)